MSILFSPIKLGSIEIRNHFVRAPTYLALATESGEATEELIERYLQLARGEAGLIITEHMYVHPLGRTRKYQMGIHTEEMMPGLQKLTAAVHNEGGRIAFELSHAGRQTKRQLIGQTPLAPSRTMMDPIYRTTPREMTEDDIQGAIRAFGDAAERAVAAGADVIHLHGSGGFLINEFLSPFYNHRKDAWGGSDENRLRFLQEIIREVKNRTPAGLPVTVKMNVQDLTPKEGITPRLAEHYITWLTAGMQGIEISEGTIAYAFMHGWLGNVPYRELLQDFPVWMRPVAWLQLKKMGRECGFREAWLLETAKRLKSALAGIPLILGGGLRRIEQMDQIVNSGDAQFVAMSRPLIREPYLVKRFREGKTQTASCISCNKCVGAAVNELPVRCYQKGVSA